MFMLVIWLQGIWLPLHGFDFARTPLWAGIAMIPLTVGLLIAGPISGILSDRFGTRPVRDRRTPRRQPVAFALLELLPVNFSYPVFGLLLFITGLTMAAFGSPDRTGVMNSLPTREGGAGSGMNTTFQNSAQVFSIGVFFTLMIAGLSASLPHSLDGWPHRAPACPRAVAVRVAHLPPVSTLFAAFLGYSPIQHLVGPAVLSHLTAAQQATLTGRSFFPTLITAPFKAGLRATFDFAIVASLVAAAVSWTRGGKVASGAGRAGRRRWARAGRMSGLLPLLVDASVPPVDARGCSGGDGVMAVKRAAAEAAPVLWRIGEVAKLTGVTTRTLRYWEELGLLQPASRTGRGRAGLRGGRCAPGDSHSRLAGTARILAG